MSTIQVLDGTMIKNGFANLFSVSNPADQARANHAVARRTIPIPLTDGGTAATGVAEQAVYANPMGLPTNGVAGLSNGVKLVAASILAPVAVAANATNYVTFTVFYRTAAGGGQVTLATFATTAVSLVAFAPQALTLAAYTVLLPAAVLGQGDVLTVSAVKSGTGVAIASATAQAFLELIVEEY
jgi:hypothetical protein